MPLNFSSLTEGQILLFALVLLRMIGFIVSSAVFSSPTINVMVKVLLSTVLSVLIYPLIKLTPAQLTGISENLLGSAAQEVFIGLTLGYLTRIFFFVLSMAGDIISTTMGLSSAQMFNPMLGTNGNAIEQFEVTVGTLIFLALNGHHVFLSGLYQSYEIIPVVGHHLNLQIFGELATVIQTLVIMGIKISAPVMGAILLTNIAMGVLGKAVPQMNVFVTSMPVTVSVGFIVLIICLPLFVLEMHQIINFTAEEFMKVMKGI